MIDYTNSNIERVSVHKVGNKTNDEELLLSPDTLDITDPRLKQLLSEFFLSPFSNPELYSFSFSNKDFTLNPLYNFATKIFDTPKTLHKNSVNLAKHLYDLAIHPQIKSGDFFVAHITGIYIEDKVIDAIGIFKVETQQPFLKVNEKKGEFSVKYDDGINIEKLDKGCLVFNVARDSGFKVCMIDRANKNAEAQYWKDSFLQIVPCSDDYHHTKEFMNITKNFVTKGLPEEFEVSKTDQIDYLNRSVEYFKTHDSFDKKEFEKEVYQDANVIKSFRNFDKSYRESNEMELSDTFDISPTAVKKQAKVFKSVLKLDKNFHVYIHGDRQLIEQGVEPDGRKFYKLYFEKEF